MYSVVSISDINLFILDQDRCRAHCYDKDKQAWMLEADASSKYLMFRLYYTDVSHVPRKYSRYVCWNLCITPATGKSINAIDAPFAKYFVQQDFDEGFTMYTDIKTEKLAEISYGYLDPDDQKLTVHVEWNDSHLLVCPQYHTLDDVSRLQRHQMWREIMALQAENYALEKQVYSYQQTLSINKPLLPGGKEEKPRVEELVDERPKTPRSPNPVPRKRESSRADRHERADRGERIDRTDRVDKNHSDRSERGERVDRPDRIDRNERNDRNNRSDRSDRSEKSERSDRSERSERSERSDRVDRSDRGETRTRDRERRPNPRERRM